MDQDDLLLLFLNSLWRSLSCTRYFSSTTQDQQFHVTLQTMAQFEWSTLLKVLASCGLKPRLWPLDSGSSALTTVRNHAQIRPIDIICLFYYLLHSPVCAKDTDTFKILNSADIEAKNLPKANGRTK